MKKSFSKTTRTMTRTLPMALTRDLTRALTLSSGILFSGSVLSTQAYANETVSGTTSDTYSEDSSVSTTETYLYPGLGVGAAAGTLIAGPVGLIIGGALGAFIGSSQTVEDEEIQQNEITTDNTDKSDETDKTLATLPESNSVISDSSEHNSTKYRNTEDDFVLAQTGPLHSVIDNEIHPQQEDLMNILVSDLSLDVYFRSGSTDIEKFYPARLSAIANLVNSMADLELHLDGYTDRRGNKDENIKLANERIDKVREQLISAGVSQHRIVSKAFGEAKIKSTAGNLEAYTFDRRVVIRFERIDDIKKSLAKAFSTIDTAFDSIIDETNEIKTSDIEAIDIEANEQTENSPILESTHPVVANTNHF